MQINVYLLTSSIHNKTAIEKTTREYLTQLNAALLSIQSKVQLVMQNDFSTFDTEFLDLIFVRTGGTEGVFRQMEKEYPSVRDAGNIHLLTSGENNSLAASVEILSYLNQNNRKGGILHGSISYVAKQIDRLARIAHAKQQLRGQRIGVLGEPSDWLIASRVDEVILQQKLGITLERISISELVQEIEQHNYPKEVEERLHATDKYPVQGALHIYGAIRRLISKYRLNAITLRCFDLLSLVHNTGCLALALLNEEGIPASCEGDIPALLTMMISNALTGVSGFQANPSRIDPETGKIVFAHCTIPLNMVTSYRYNTHFESGIGVAIQGELPEGKATLLKMDGNLTRCFVQDVMLCNNPHEEQLCRTQIVVDAPEAIDYFFHHPIGNHHIILPGHHTELINAFWKSL